MRNYFIILLPVDENAFALWARINDDTLTESGEISLSDLSDISDQALPIRLIIPGQNVQTFTYDLPKMSRREKEKAVLFSIEDSLSTSLEGLHVAFKDTETEDGLLKTASVIEAAFMENIQNWAHEQAVDLISVHADYQALLSLDVTALTLSDRIIQPGFLGRTFDPDWYEGEATELDRSKLFEAIKNNSAHATNLMQGAFAPGSQFGAIRKPLLHLSGFIAALAIAALFLGVMETRSISAQAHIVKQQTAELYTSQTGQTAPSDPARAIRVASRNGAVAPTQFLALNSIAFQALSTFDDVTIDRLSYQNNRDEIQLRLIYPSFERADAVKQAMEQAGGDFTPGGVREQNGRFVGEAVLKMQAGGG